MRAGETDLMDVEAWLDGLDLGQYQAVFRDGRINADMLPQLSEQRLQDIGIPLGHRLRMLRAIRELAAAPSAGARGQDAPERRQLTIMSCDLVGSTALTAQLDPEDMADLIRAFRAAVAAAIVRFDGRVAKWSGDGAMVYFGYPAPMKTMPSARCTPQSP
jgi:class 3 adenylate cyclase